MLNVIHLEEIESYAYRYMLKSEIEIILGVSSDIWLDEIEANNAFVRGRLKRKADLNGKIIELANQLSSPAILLEKNLSDETFLNDKLNR